MEGKLVKAYCTQSHHWMIDLAFSPDGTTIVALCESITVSYGVIRSVDIIFTMIILKLKLYLQSILP